jgi:hypothetical protein
MAVVGTSREALDRLVFQVSRPTQLGTKETGMGSLAKAYALIDGNAAAIAEQERSLLERGRRAVDWDELSARAPLADLAIELEHVQEDINRTVAVLGHLAAASRAARRLVLADVKASDPAGTIREIEAARQLLSEHLESLCRKREGVIAAIEAEHGRLQQTLARRPREHEAPCPSSPSTTERRSLRRTAA